MYDRPEQNALVNEFNRERSVRRTVTVLETKRQRIRDELQQLVRHMAVIVPVANQSSQTYTDLLQDAATRIGDDAFAQLLLQILQEVK